MKKTIIRLLTSFITLLLLLGFLQSHVVATQAASVSINPDSDSVYVGDTIAVTVTIYGDKIFAYSGSMNCDKKFSGFTGKFVQDCEGEASVSFTYEYQAAAAGTGRISVNDLEVAVDDPDDPDKVRKEDLGEAACTITVIGKGWFWDNGKWYYRNSNGALAKGWLKDKNIWYYLDEKTGMMKTGWVKDGGAWYYLNASGAMQTGWVKIGGTWYYLKSSGAMAAGEWVPGCYWLSSNGAWTYQPVGSWKKNATGWWFGDTSGWYAKNETVRINDVLYRFNAAGYWIK